MPEEFFDAEFTARMVRALQLKRGRSPAFLSDEIVPVLDLSALLSRIPEGGEAAALESNIVSAFAGKMFRRYLPPWLVAVGEVGFRQVFNPADSGRAVIVMEVRFEHVTVRAMAGRRNNTPALTLDPQSPLTNMNAGQGASVAQIRRDDLAPAAFPPAGSGPLTHWRQNIGSGGALIIESPVILEPGEGYIWYATGNNPADDTDPPGEINVGLTVVLHTIEAGLA